MIYSSEKGRAARDVEKMREGQVTRTEGGKSRLIYRNNGSKRKSGGVAGMCSGEYVLTQEPWLASCRAFRRDVP